MHTLTLFWLQLLSLYLYFFGVHGRSMHKETPSKILSQRNFKSIMPIVNPYEYDCVELYKQPAFDHPLLKNHKIQMRPSFLKDFPTNTSEGHLQRGGCPPRMVPIMKMKTHDHHKKATNYDNQSFHRLTVDYPGQHFATLDTSIGIYHGAHAMINIYNPQTEANQKSAAYIWVQNGEASELNDIHVGWEVNSKLYGDHRTRLTAYWTADNYQKTGCYNTLCPGFVQVDQNYPFGADLGSSVFGDQEQYVVKVLIIQDKPSGNWWLSLGEPLVKIGYWPKEIFPQLAFQASKIRYGGWTYTPSGISPPMGSSHFPSRVTRKSSYFVQVKFADSTYNFVDVDGMKTFTDAPDCYDVKDWGHKPDPIGRTFVFGGPGGKCAST